MKRIDARRLTPEAQEDLRRRVVHAVRELGMGVVEAARTFGVARMSVHRWLSAVEEKGVVALRSRPRGRPRSIQLEPHQAATTVRMILGGCPDQLRLPFALWTREAVQQLVSRKFGIDVSVWTIGRYLHRWGMSPQKPLRRAFEQDPIAVRRWLDEEYPAIRSEAKAVGAEIWWGDEMGVRSDHQTGTSWGRIGETPIVPGTGRRFGCNMISALTNRGHLAFMLFEGKFNAPLFLNFLRRLLRIAKRRVFLIVDRHSVHRAAKVEAWLKDNAKGIRLFFLPAYSPRLNPDELLNQDVKTNAVGRRRARDEAELKADLRAYLRSTQRQPDVVQNYFLQDDVLYAAV